MVLTKVVGLTASHSVNALAATVAIGLMVAFAGIMSTAVGPMLGALALDNIVGMIRSRG
jgi:hypothetical protein